ncbi:MAG: oligoendopeptidase F, partial [Lachnospiraceae bacterium]|nr:oligoendopeptidase F [Lachnospiraceae bacterium]
MRNEVDQALTWDLSLIYPTDEALWADVQRMQQQASNMVDTYRGQLKNAEQVLACLADYEQVRIIMEHAGSYASLAVEVDYYDDEAKVRASKVESILTETMSNLSFVESEIAYLPEQVLQEAIVQAGGCKVYLQDLLAQKPHMLNPEAERVVAAMGHTIHAPYEIYNTLKLADMKFEEFEANGKCYPLGYSLFEDDYEYEPDTRIRRAAFAAFSQKIAQYQHATAAAFNAHLQQERVMARLRGFADLEEMDLFYQKVTREMYDRQIDLIMEKLAPHMRKYAALIQKIHHLDRMTYADLKLPIDPAYSPDVTIDKARQYIEQGLSVMGDDYVSMVREAFDRRWIDFAKNQGKSTGGFCESPYQKGSFILLSWNGKMSDVFTLAHELGHAGHFRACGNAQSVFDTQVPNYFVEAPSTINELLMAHYMIRQNEDPRFRRWVLANMVSNTYYHNFVTHLLEAAYQREANRIVSEGRSVQAGTLSEIFRQVLEKFWGDAVELTPGAELTWMRQPHYYMGLYSYSYSASLTISTQMCKRIENVGQ